MVSITLRSVAASALALALALAPMAAATQQAGSQVARGAEEIAIPEGQVALGSVRLPAAVMADGQRLEAGTYRLRLTGEVAKPAVVGQVEKLERWVEFVQGSTVKARAVASVVPRAAITEVAESAAPAAGKHRVERLKGDDYLRVWINKSGDHVLLHLPLVSGS